jgi:hypothetical protein
MDLAKKQGLTNIVNSLRQQEAQHLSRINNEAVKELAAMPFDIRGDNPELISRNIVRPFDDINFKLQAAQHQEGFLESEYGKKVTGFLNSRGALEDSLKTLMNTHNSRITGISVEDLPAFKTIQLLLKEMDNIQWMINQKKKKVVNAVTSTNPRDEIINSGMVRVNR